MQHSSIPKSYLLRNQCLQSSYMQGNNEAADAVYSGIQPLTAGDHYTSQAFSNCASLVKPWDLEF